MNIALTTSISRPRRSLGHEQEQLGSFECVLFIRTCSIDNDIVASRLGLRYTKGYRERCCRLQILDVDMCTLDHKFQPNSVCGTTCRARGKQTLSARTSSEVRSRGGR